MLVHLAIRDIVLIDRLDLDVGPGLTVLTGETGAGKSILLDAFSLALGARGDGSLVRHGVAQGQVTAVFDVAPDHPVRDIVAELALELDGSDLLLRRVQMADGRTRAFIGDAPVSAQSLRRVGRALVEIHGQHDERALIDPTAHRALLDAFGGLNDQVEKTRKSLRTARQLEQELAAEGTRVETARAQADYLRHAAAELSALAPEPEEEAALAERRARMMQAEKAVADLREAYESVAGDSAPNAAIAGIARRLERRAGQAADLIEPAVRALGSVLEALDAAQELLERSLREAAFDPKELDRVEDRLFALRAASRKHGVAVADLPVLAQKFTDDLAQLDAGEARLAALTTAVARARAVYGEAAAALSAARRGCAAELDAAVNRELRPLKLERARFLTEIASDARQASPEGIDKVDFWVETNPGSRPGPLARVASGGELARFVLALKVVLADRGSAPTLIFDEIDTGIGGAVADAVGQRLARLARKVQVLAVTHAPQVAAKAAEHLRIIKSEVDAGAGVVTRIVPLAPDTRQEEIARMLAGARVTDQARAAARSLLENAD